MLALDDHPVGSLPDDAEVVILVHDLLSSVRSCHIDGLSGVNEG